MLLSLLSLVLAAPAPEPPARPPKGPAPVVMICKADKDGRPFLQAFVSRLELKSKIVPTLKDGKVVDVAQNVSVYVTEQKQVYLDDKDARCTAPTARRSVPRLCGTGPDSPRSCFPWMARRWTRSTCRLRAGER